ncbi:membrane protein insertion efficiency factor YidD [Parelusimicrobium proximum]|uniref:membrane protein insertion efficiency factor YidD n=1 Tax=Parelusimicrobium proximum TaxID=3228953 RepID=UPI003D17E8F9
MKKLILLLLSGFMIFIRPLLGARGCCRFHPTCSCYAKQAVLKHGVIKGGLLSLWRVLRCNPFTAGGIDLVP